MYLCLYPMTISSSSLWRAAMSRALRKCSQSCSVFLQSVMRTQRIDVHRTLIQLLRETQRTYFFSLSQYMRERFFIFSPYEREESLLPGPLERGDVEHDRPERVALLLELNVHVLHLGHNRTFLSVFSCRYFLMARLSTGKARKSSRKERLLSTEKLGKACLPCLSGKARELF